MVTVLNNPSAPAVERTTIERTTDDSVGWAVAVILLLAVVAVGVFVWARSYSMPAAPASNGGDTINVTLPASDNSGTLAPENTGNTGETPPAQ